MQNLTPAPGPNPRAPKSYARRAWLLFALGALLVCAPHVGGDARAQEAKTAGEGVRRPTINVKPFEDVALAGQRLAEEGRIGWETTADFVVTAERDDDGSLKPDSVRITWLAPPDEVLSRYVQQTLTALSESRVLGALEGAKAVSVAFKLSRENVSLRLDGELPSAADATKYAEGYGLLLRAGLIAKRGTPEGRLYESLSFTSDGKTFKMSFEMPRREANRLIAEMLARRAAKAADQD